MPKQQYVGTRHWAAAHGFSVSIARKWLALADAECLRASGILQSPSAMKHKRLLLPLDLTPAALIDAVEATLRERQERAA